MRYEQRQPIEKLRLKLRRVRYAKTRQEELLGHVGRGSRFGLVDPGWLTRAFQKVINNLETQEKDIIKKIHDLSKTQKTERSNKWD